MYIFVFGMWTNTHTNITVHGSVINLWSVCWSVGRCMPVYCVHQLLSLGLACVRNVGGIILYNAIIRVCG